MDSSLILYIYILYRYVCVFDFYFLKIFETNKRLGLLLIFISFLYYLPNLIVQIMCLCILLTLYKYNKTMSTTYSLVYMYLKTKASLMIFFCNCTKSELWYVLACAIKIFPSNTFRTRQLFKTRVCTPKAKESSIMVLF